MVILLGQIKYLSQRQSRALSVATSDPEARVSGGWRGDSQIEKFYPRKEVRRGLGPAN